MKKSSEKILQGLTTNTGECSSIVGHTSQICSSKPVISTITKFICSTRSSATDCDHNSAIEETKKVLGCNSESCIISHPKFRKYAVNEGNINTRMLDNELSTRFKTRGPRESTKLLSNFNIDEVLQEWAVKYKTFYNYDFNMIDFDYTGGSLARIDIIDILEGNANQITQEGRIKRPCDTFACVLNTDKSTGKGKHWVAIFGDCRGKKEWSVEYFNSSGNPPPKPVINWMEKTSAKLSDHRQIHSDKYGDDVVISVPVTNIRHQESKTECGNYSLYYIRRRLEGMTYKEFQNNKVPDSAMIEFRKHIFRYEN